MSFDAFCLSLLALVFASAFLMKLAEAVQTIARARLLEAEVAERAARKSEGPGRYVLYGSCNDKAVGVAPTVTEVLCAYSTGDAAVAAAGKGDKYGRPLRWWAVVDAQQSEFVRCWNYEPTQPKAMQGLSGYRDNSQEDPPGAAF